jgi:hypothetical protein
VRISRDTSRDDRRAPVLILCGKEDTIIATKRFMPDGGIIEELCAPDAVSPAQFHEMWNGTPERSAEFKLALAVLEQALEDLDKHRDALGNERRRLYRQAQSWVRSNDRGWPYSFVNVCDMLNVPADRLRTHILAEPTTNIDVDYVTTSANDDLSFANEA